MNSPTPDARFYLCPQCGRPIPTEDNNCRCGYKLSAALPTYRLCPDCKRFVPSPQSICDCGYNFPISKQPFHFCPVCGQLLLYEQRTCECGYNFPTPPLIFPPNDMEHFPQPEKPIGYIPVPKPRNQFSSSRSSRPKPSKQNGMGRFTVSLFCIVAILCFLSILSLLSQPSNTLYAPAPAATHTQFTGIIASSAPADRSIQEFVSAPTHTQFTGIIASSAPADRSIQEFVSAPTHTQFTGVTASPAPANRPTPAPTPEPSVFDYSNLSPVQRPENGAILEKPSFHSNYFSVKYGAPLTIDASLCPVTTHYYVKLKRTDNNVTYLAFFVDGGKTVDVDAPFGEYELLYASGTEWYGKDALFGSDTEYYRADDLFEFYESGGYANGWTVTLSKQYNGNLDVDKITADEFAD